MRELTRISPRLPTATPTFTLNRWFARAEVSYVGITDGAGYGALGTKKDQVRGMLELVYAGSER